MNLDPVLSALAAALAGEGPAVEFGPGGSGQAARVDGSPLPEGTAVVERTSGSTGQPKATALTVGN